MKQPSFLILVIIVVLISSCQKSNNEVIIDPIDHDTLVILGETKGGISITTFDTAIWVYHPLGDNNEHFYELDIDGDDIADFKFRSERYRGGSGFDYSYAGVYILDPNIGVSFMEKQDTIRRCQYYITTNLGDQLYDIHYNFYSGYSCANSIWDTIYPPHTLTIPTIHRYSDTIMNENYTYQDYFPFAYNNISSNSGIPIFIYKVYRGFWDNTYSSYFVFQKKVGNAYKKGWVKISVENVTKIRLYEFAYQID